ncbi:DUF374 domain-containing protein [candidate division KSB1 bacterium]|nr:DUF374 domain-containing protein [candidate division KSB1 bacterium]
MLSEASEKLCNLCTASKTKARYRVDNVPWFWRPIWLGYSWLAGFGCWAVFHLLHLTCRVRIEGRENLTGCENCIYCFWHQVGFLLFVTLVRSHRRYAMMAHPAAYMKPVHIVLRLMGVRILLGSGGEEGRQAAATLAGLLKQGWSTAIAPDGPRGPGRVLKKGVLHIALESGVPVVPVRCEAKPVVRLRWWDRKLVPLPFARITVVFEQPLTVTETNFAEAAELLAKRMSGAEA